MNYVYCVVETNLRWHCYSRGDIKSEDKIPMSASNMFSLMLHTTICLFTLITGAVNLSPGQPPQGQIHTGVKDLENSDQQEFKNKKFQLKLETRRICTKKKTRDKTRITEDSPFFHVQQLLATKCLAEIRLLLKIKIWVDTWITNCS